MKTNKELKERIARLTAQLQKKNEEILKLKQTVQSFEAVLQEKANVSKDSKRRSSKS